MPLSPIDASERGSPSTSPYLRTRSDETPERRSSRLLPLGALTPPRSALARVSTAAALICATLLALSFAFASDGARRTALRLLDPSDGCDACREASNSTARHQVGPTEPCAYGELPGRWHAQPGDNHSTWQTVSATCPLHDRVAEYGVKLYWPPKPQPTARPLNLLTFGDSIDRYLLQDTCEIGQGVDEPCGLAENGTANEAIIKECQRREMNRCTMPAITMGRQHIIGISPEGPYFQARGGAPYERVQRGWQLFVAETGRDPDMVVFSSALWDIARLVQYFPAEVGNVDDMPEDLVQDYMRNTSMVLGALEALAAPGTLLVYHNTAWIQRSDVRGDRGDHRHPQLGRHAHLVAFNAAGRQVATERGWAIVDVERMSGALAEPADYLRDRQHPDPQFLNNVLNVYLNLWHQHAERCDVLVGPLPAGCPARPRRSDEEGSELLQAAF